MTNEDRQISLEKQRIKKYGKDECDMEAYCEFCKPKELADPCCCAKAYNRMIREIKKRRGYENKGTN